jgi:flavin reductase (DIM6/NTAB) family NADH-FMN oxidoreductase RutF
MPLRLRRVQMTALQIPDLSSGFRNAMRRLATTVSVVTCADKDGWHGMTATAVASVCTEPPALLVCINTATDFYGPLSASGSFCINLLRSPHVRVSQAFGGRFRGAERFARGDWALARGLPFLVDAQANLFCKTEAITHFGTHGVFIGRVDEVRFCKDVAPLVYQDGHYVTTSQLLDA